MGWTTVVPAGTVKGFSFCSRVQTSPGAYTASDLMTNEESFLGGKWQGREGDHSPPRSVKIKNAWSYTSLLHTSSWRDT